MIQPNEVLHVGDIVRMKKLIPAVAANGRLHVQVWILE